MLQTLIRASKLLATYFFGQGLTQFIQLLTGFVIIRALAKEDYAVYTLIMAISATTHVLVQFGAGQALTGLLGSVKTNLEAMGRFILAGRFYRNRIIPVAIIFLLPILYLASAKLELSGYFPVFLWLCLSVSVFFRTEVAIFRPVLLVHRELRKIYTLGVLGGMLRLGCILLAYSLGVFTVGWAIVLVALQTLFEGFFIRRQAQQRIRYSQSETDISAEKTALKQQTLPRAPGYAFHAFESQVTIFILTVLGTTNSLAELGALSRIGVLFVIFNMMGSMLIAPYFSTIKAAQVHVWSLFSIFGAALFFSLLACLVYLYPQPLLLLLGEGYQGLGFEVFLVVVGAGISTFGSLIFSICTARKYIFPWFPFVDVAPVIVAMVVCFAFFDLSELVGVLYYGICIASVRLLSKVFVFAYGLRGEGRES